MFDFYYGSKKDIVSNPEDFLIFVKKLLPKSCNSLPETALITLFRELKKTKANVIIETGVGASTICFFLYCYLYNKKFYSFDLDQFKISLVRQAINEGICKHLNINIFKYWYSVNSDSTSEYCGIYALKEKRKEKFNFLFLDSDHNHNHVKKEINAFLKISEKNSCIMLDDSNMKFINHNNGYINVLRKKMDLKPISIKNNISKNALSKTIFDYLKKNTRKTQRIYNPHLLKFSKDSFYRYFGPDVKYAKEKSGSEFSKFLSKKEKNIIKTRISIFKIKK